MINLLKQRVFRFAKKQRIRELGISNFRNNDERQKEIDTAVQVQIHSIFCDFDVSEVKVLRAYMGCRTVVITFTSMVDCELLMR